jgi:hypothetical protein
MAVSNANFASRCGRTRTPEPKPDAVGGGLWCTVGVDPVDLQEAQARLKELV